MAFGGFGGGGGFGTNNNTGSTFGGFGSTTNTTPGFGAGTSGFGATNTAGNTGTGLFGGGATGGAGFGASNTTGGAFGGGGFGAKPAFGTPTTSAGGNSLFGGTTTATSGGTGFGFGNTNNATTTPFGGGGTTSLFGASKPATTFGTGTAATTGFGGTANTGTGLFGAGGTTGTGFGATTNPGIGTNVGDPPGTAVAQFTPYQEKEPNNSAMSNSYQQLCFMDAYKKWSSDELRLVDYNQGRKTGGTGGTGAFGASNFGATSGFGTGTTNTTGGFGANTGTSLFGTGATGTTGGFGANAATTTTPAFGGGGGLFGANKPATTGAFGATTTQPAAGTGGLFGTGGTGFGTNTTGTTGGFGTAATNTGGGLFGNTAAKPATANTFSFGNTGTTGFGNTATPTPAFGANTATANTGTGGLFGNTAGNTTGGGLFGNTQQQQQQPAATGFGGAFGNTAQNTGATGGLFGAAAAKPAGGLFGASTTTGTGATGGLFGNTAGATTASPFGGAAAQPGAGGLFGAKPAATGGGLFGTGAATTTGTGAFGSLGATQTAQPATGGLFGSLGQNAQQKPGGLFGASTATGGGLFGNTQTAQPQTNSMFGSTLGQQQPQTGLGNSLLGASQGQQQAPQSFSTSINDISAYGASTLFSGLPDDKVQNPGPLATPLSGKPKGKSRSILPMYKLSPANASRFVTPQKRGYGFSVSAYGSPATPSSISSTPGGLGQSLLAGSVNRNLSKSISASNLRRSFNVEDSILQPGAFSANSSMRLLGNSNNHKKLVINKDMRSDLFTPPAQAKGQEDSNSSRKLSKRVSFETPGDAPKGAIAESSKDVKPVVNTASNGVNGNKVSPTNANPEMEQVKGKELAIVHEEESPTAIRPEIKSGSKIEPGEYWMDPTPETIRAMNRMQRQTVSKFTIGRANVGSVQFKVPVDLNNINLDEIFDNIVVLVPRSATVYPVAAKKPPVGKGLNVPALISLEQSWPRGGKDVTGRRLEKHIEKLKTSIPDTTFESYDKETGVWTFSVEHFTTYGLDDDDEDYDEEETEIPATKAAQVIPSSSTAQTSTSPIDPDDTFEFKRSRRAVPGAFDQAETLSDDEDADVAHHQGTTSYETLDADAPLPSREWPEDESMADGPDDYQLEAYDYSSEQGTIEAHNQYGQARYDDNEVQVPAGILRARMRAVKKATAPTKIEVAGGDDWTQILQASVRAPRTVDRAALRAMNESGEVWEMKDRGSPAPQKVVEGPGFATSIDLMKSLFDQAKGPSQSAQAAPTKGFVKWPYQKRSKVDEETDQDQASSAPARPAWGPDERLVTTTHHGDVVQAVDGTEAVIAPKVLNQLQQYIETVSGYQGNSGPEFKQLAQGDTLWEVASLLFDDNGYGLPAFWKQLVSESTKHALDRAGSYEEKAIIHLAGDNVAEACAEVLAGKNPRLAILVSTIGSESTKRDIKAQLKDWRDSNVLSDISEPIRAIYEILAGNACVAAGVKDVPIENRVASFSIRERFGLDWMQSFGLRLFYSTCGEDGDEAKRVKEAVRCFQDDVEQDREKEPDSAVWSLLKAFANQEFDWAAADEKKLGWLMTRAIHTTGKVEFGEDDAERLDRASLEFARSLTAQGEWVKAAFVLLQLSDSAAREAAVRDHLGRHANVVGNPKKEGGAFVMLKKFGVPEGWIWEAKALDFRSRGETRHEFLALVWAENYVEANRVFVSRVGPGLVIERDFKTLFSYAQLLFKVKKFLADWDRAGVVYLLYPMVRLRNRNQPLDRLDVQLFDGLLALRGTVSEGDVQSLAAIADMAEELIKCRPITRAVGVDAVLDDRASKGGAIGLGADGRLFELLPGDVRGRYLRRRALEGIC
ncbi:hypothetical protein QBC38DRAFT_517422 [Podospora fimiseda]|uniref:Peptidase S59 domain-containing protein n=1 Tax=Podospora fimiseda TaxID=252190 RepID=A0AAN7BVA5_9PEZI|nr:hypothetical protein QBC38DRAFT_517422 [Podospora fimiseda]